MLRAALLAGAAAGALLFVYQYLVIVPRITAAEAFEDHSDDHHSHEWKPAEGLERNYYTAAATVLTGIGYAALLLAVAALTGLRLDERNGWLWGVAGFACFVLAPGLGLPPEPPGMPAAALEARQLWWLLAAASTAGGLILAAKGGGRWLYWVGAGVLLLLPHLVGAPRVEGMATLFHEFAIAAVLGNAMFWLVLGPLAGRLHATA